MARKRKVGHSQEIPNMNDDLHLLAERNEMMKLTRMVEAWEFTCSFCFKKFPSAQAMGGHQNAHRHERMEERRLYIRDPIGYRKRAYIKAMKERSSTGSSNPGPAGQVLDFEFLNINGTPKIIQKPLASVMEFNASAAPANIINNHYFCQTLKIKGESQNVMMPVVVMNFLPPKEVSLVDGVGTVGGQDVNGKAQMEMEGGGCGLDLSLKL